MTSPAGTYRLADLAPQAYTIRFDPTCSRVLTAAPSERKLPEGASRSPGGVTGGVDGVAGVLAGHPSGHRRRSPWQDGQVYDRYYHTAFR